MTVVEQQIRIMDVHAVMLLWTKTSEGCFQHPAWKMYLIIWPVSVCSLSVPSKKPTLFLLAPPHLTSSNRIPTFASL